MKIYIILMFALCLIGCQDLTDKKVVGKFYLVSTDGLPEQTTLSYSIDSGESYIGIIPATVFAVGFDSNYIIAKQCVNCSSTYSQSEVVNYYILPINGIDSLNPQKTLLGPYKELEFNVKKKELNIDRNIPFAIDLGSGK